MAAPQASSRLEMLQARFQQRLLAEKEQKLLQLYDQQQLRAHQVAQRGSAGSNDSNSSTQGNSNASHHQTTVTRTSTTHSTSNPQGGGKVRQMFDERRQTTVKGIDKSYPLEPLENRSRKHQTVTTSSVNSTSQLKNGNPTSNRRSVVTRRTVRTEANGGLNNGKPIVTYHEEVTREIDDNGDRRNERDEFYDDNYQHSRYENENRRIERPSNLDVQDVTNENVAASHRSTAKIHLAELDKSSVTDRTSECQVSEQAESDEIIEAPDRLPRRSSGGKKTLQTETRIERPKNAIAKKIGQTIKQFSGNSASFPKKRNEIPQSGSSTRVSKVEEISRESSASPEVGKKSRNSSPEVSDVKEKMSTSPGGGSPNKNSGYTRVSQLYHKNSTDFYPRRKSEFEKSKTFRKLQMELGESSPEPNEPEESSPTAYEKKCERKSSVFEENIYSRRRSSASPTADRFGQRKMSVERSPERPGSRRGSASPYRRRESLGNENMERQDSRSPSPIEKKSNFESSTYSSRSHSVSQSPILDHSRERKISERRSPSPIFRKHSIVKKDDPEKAGIENHRVRKTSENFSHRTFSSNRDDFFKREKIDKEKSPEAREYKTWIDRKESISESEEKKFQNSVKKTSFDSSTYSSRQHSSSPTEFSPLRRTSREKSPSERESIEKSEQMKETKRKMSREKSPEIRSGSESPTYRTELIRKLDNRRTSNDESSFASSTYSSRQHCFSTSREKSPKMSEVPEKFGRKSPERSPSPSQRRNSYVKKTEKKITNDGIVTTFESTYSSKRSTSPGVDYEFSSEIRRTEEQYPERPESRRGSGSPRRESIKKSDDVKSTSETKTSHYAASTYSSRRHSSASGIKSEREERDDEANDKRQDNETSRKSGEQLRSFELVKKLVRASTPEKTSNISERKLNEPGADARRSKSPEQNIERMKKNKITQNKNEENQRAMNRERAKSPEMKSRKMSPSILNTTVSKAKKNTNRTSVEKKEEKFDSKVTKGNSKKMRKESYVISSPEKTSSNENLNRERNISEQGMEKNELLERIERIRSTLSRSDRSEQNLRSKDFERTDSVESALKRFDSIGVETEHRVTVGIDETDLKRASEASPRFQKKKPIVEPKCVKKIISPLTEEEKKTETKKEPKKVDAKSRTSKERVTKTEEKSNQSVKSSKKEKSVVNTPQNSEKTKSRSKGQKRLTTIVKKSQFRSEEPSGRGEARDSDLSPVCKRKLFQDSESEVENENSTIVMTITRVSSPEIKEIEMRKNRENEKKETESVACLEPGKMLRSIDDIRKSMKNETHDFQSESKEFGTTERELKKENVSASGPEFFTTGTSVKIVKTVKMTGEKPVVKVERSVIKLPITRHRVAKSPSPDIGTKRPIEGKTRTVTSSVRRSVASSPVKSPEAVSRYGSGIKSQGRTSSSLGNREVRSQKEFTITTEYSDVADGPEEISEVTITELSTTKKSADSFVIDFSDSQTSDRKEDRMGRPPSERTVRARQEGSRTSTPVSRAASALSTTSSVTSGRGKSPQTNAKSKMSTKAKSPSSNGPRGSSVPKAPPSVAENDGLVACNICGRRFNSDRVGRHEQICSKTATKKRKQFDATIHRVKGTELESFVRKAGSKKPERKTQKPELKSNWRRKHEDFINAIRSAKQVQAHLAAGGKLSDLPPPPPSDTSDYVQCPHCGRKFNQAAAERHIPKCQTMMHNKPNPRAPPKPKR